MDAISLEVRRKHLSIFTELMFLFHLLYGKLFLIRFTLGEGLDNFWRVLLEGKNCVVDIPAERFDTTFWYDADESKPGKTQTTKAALIEG